MLIHLIAAARPNFMKIAPLYHALKKIKWAEPVIVHTGQHYDLNMSDAFFQDLGLPEPDVHLGVGSGSHAEQTGRVMMSYEKMLMDQCPDLVIVVGDVNSTMACTLAASKVQYPKSVPLSQLNQPNKSIKPKELPKPLVAHLEAGLRSFDRTMPEEINRLVTDTLAQILWTPSPDADQNLLREGIAPEKIHRVGNIMIDSLEMMRDTIEEQNAFEDFGLRRGEYVVITLHRPSNVDDQDVLRLICLTLRGIALKIPMIFPVHPRTRKGLETNGLLSILDVDGLHLIEPLNYVRFMNLVFNCRLAITDSGGIQEETTYLGIPCLTMRPNTERPVTIQQGTNQLCTFENLETKVEEVLSGKNRRGDVPEFWDGKTADRVIRSIRVVMGVQNST